MKSVQNPILQNRLGSWPHKLPLHEVNELTITCISRVSAFLSWQPGDRLVLTLPGYTTDRKLGVEGWRCVFDPRTGEFPVLSGWRL
jgi:hypothetical protein